MRVSATEAARLLSRRWLGQRGVVLVDTEGHRLVVGTSDGRRPLGLPLQFRGYPIVVRRRGPVHAQGIVGERALDNTSVVRPEEEEEDPDVYRTVGNVMGIAGLVAAPVAMAVSYKRNHSLGWAFLSGIVAIPYLIYVGISGPRQELT
jgi:hypothetical protein